MCVRDNTTQIQIQIQIQRQIQIQIQIQYNIQYTIHNTSHVIARSVLSKHIDVMLCLSCECTILTAVFFSRCIVYYKYKNYKYTYKYKYTHKYNTNINTNATHNTQHMTCHTEICVAKTRQRCDPMFVMCLRNFHNRFFFLRTPKTNSSILSTRYKCAYRSSTSI